MNLLCGNFASPPLRLEAMKQLLSAKSDDLEVQTREINGSRHNIRSRLPSK